MSRRNSFTTSVKLWLPVVALLVSVPDSAESLKLGAVDNKLGTGGCSLQLPSSFVRHEGAYVFVSGADEDALIRLNDQDVSLSQVRSNGERQNQTRWYEGADHVSVRVDYTMTGGCPATEPGCKLTYYDAVITVKRGKAHKTVAAKGVCAD